MSNYDDIINLPHHQSPNRKHMTNIERAAQFSPFAALTGYDAAISETARLVDSKIELNEELQAILNDKIQILIEHISEHPYIDIEYFIPDAHKEGGSYEHAFGTVRRIDSINRVLVFDNKEEYNFDDILNIESDLYAGIF